MAYTGVSAIINITEVPLHTHNMNTYIVSLYGQNAAVIFRMEPQHGIYTVCCLKNEE